MSEWNMSRGSVYGDVGRERTEKEERRGVRVETEDEEEDEEEEERAGRVNKEDVASSSPYRVFGGPTSLDAGGQGGTDGPKRGFLFGVGLCSTTFPILK